MVDVETIIQGGAVGISVFLIILIAFILRKVFTLMGNHMNHNTEALTKLSEKIEKDVEAQKDTAQTMRDLKDVMSRKKR